MSQISIGSYEETNNIPVTSSTAKIVGNGDVFVGDIFGPGQQNADVYRQRSNGVFVGIDGHKN